MGTAERSSPGGAAIKDAARQDESASGMVSAYRLVVELWEFRRGPAPFGKDGAKCFRYFHARRADRRASLQERLAPVLDKVLAQLRVISLTA